MQSLGFLSSHKKKRTALHFFIDRPGETLHNLIMDNATTNAKGNKMTNEIKKFEVGKTYYTRSICDHNCIWEMTVIKRTAKRVTLQDKHGRVSNIGVKPSYDGTEEICFFNGRHSMAPSIGATDTKKLLTDWEIEAARDAEKAEARAKAEAEALALDVEETAPATAADSIAAIDARIDELKKQIAEKESRLAELSNAPAAQESTGRTYRATRRMNRAR